MPWRAWMVSGPGLGWLTSSSTLSSYTKQPLLCRVARFKPVVEPKPAAQPQKQQPQKEQQKPPPPPQQQQQAQHQKQLPAQQQPHPQSQPQQPSQPQQQPPQPQQPQQRLPPPQQRAPAANTPAFQRACQEHTAKLLKLLRDGVSAKDLGPFQKELQECSEYGEFAGHSFKSLSDDKWSDVTGHTANEPTTSFGPKRARWETRLRELAGLDGNLHLMDKPCGACMVLASFVVALQACLREAATGCYSVEAIRIMEGVM
jgi:hypothetical protein